MLENNMTRSNPLHDTGHHRISGSGTGKGKFTGNSIFPNRSEFSDLIDRRRLTLMAQRNKQTQSRAVEILFYLNREIHRSGKLMNILKTQVSCF